ncbi:hypothetical protein FB45DRAFT_1138115 [Roridomyces roridus]|uniref:Uncharacterized protein n=1 Tax=Roridomyces roridus TaxID=1738132 RepID=A0AAD7C1E3_9AGAR|nr:hypothetical protein FB45DRAFT_1138115 [Roridomyces roridus]
MGAPAGFGLTALWQCIVLYWQHSVFFVVSTTCIECILKTSSEVVAIAPTIEDTYGERLMRWQGYTAAGMMGLRIVRTDSCQEAFKDAPESSTSLDTIHPPASALSMSCASGQCYSVAGDVDSVIRLAV